MGAAGKAFIAHTKALSPAAGVATGGYGPPPHPLVLRPGQRYWQRGGKRSAVVTLTRVTAGGGVSARRDDAHKRRVTLSLERLLARRADGQGRYYQFQGYAQRRAGYSTAVVVLRVTGGRVLLCCPEWHPARPIDFDAQLVPEPARNPGAWLSCRADLSAATPARLQLHDLELSAAPHLVHPVAVRTEAARAAEQRPRVGRGCGDVVVGLDDSAWCAWQAGRHDGRIFVAPNRPPLRYIEGASPEPAVGGRVFLAQGGWVRVYATLDQLEPHPNGSWLVCQRRLVAVAAPVPAPAPVGWRWRWWTEADEEEGRGRD